MIEKCITEKTNPLIIRTNSIIEFNTNDCERFNSIAKRISEETGVPQELIYKEPYFFFIGHWHKIGNEWYFYKSDGYDFHFINELLGETISKYFNLETVHYVVAKLCVDGKEEEYGLASKNFCDKNFTYKKCWDYGFEAQADLSILENIRRICKSEEEYLLLQEDLKKFFTRDFYTFQTDRSGNNFLFKITPEGVRLAPLYDYEYSFTSSKPQYYRNQIALIDLENKKTRNILRGDTKFQELFHIIMQADMPSFIKQIEDEHCILVDSDLKDYYKERDSDIKKLVRRYRLIK